MHFLYFTISNWSKTTHKYLKLHKTCLHQQKFYPTLKSFTQALLVMLVTNITSGSKALSTWGGKVKDKGAQGKTCVTRIEVKLCWLTSQLVVRATLSATHPNVWFPNLLSRQLGNQARATPTLPLTIKLLSYRYIYSWTFHETDFYSNKM